MAPKQQSKPKLVLKLPSDGDKLHDAAENRDLRECWRLLAAGVPVDSVGGWCNEGALEETALAAAAWKGYADVAQLLLDNGASVNKVDGRYRNTPLLRAAFHGRAAVVALLLEYGASNDTVNKGRNTPLLCGASQGHPVVVALLLENGASATVTNELLRTALHEAADTRHAACVRTLLAATLPSGIALEMRRHVA